MVRHKPGSVFVNGKWHGPQSSLAVALREGEARQRVQAAEAAAAAKAAAPPPPKADLPACFFCGYEFTKNDTGELTAAEKTACYGHLLERYDNRGDDCRCRPHSVPFLDIVTCAHCAAEAAAGLNTFGDGGYVHPGIRALDAARERRLKQLDDAAPRPYRDKHPGWTKWDAAVKAGRIALGIVCRYRLVPGASKLGKGVKGIAVESATMDETELADFRARLAAIDAAQKERKRLRIEAAKASQEAAMASCRTIGESAAAVESQVQAA